MKQPCDRKCPGRKASCAVTCPDWAKWEEWKKQEYKKRLAESEVTNAVFEGRIRCGKYVSMN